jgi:hypothetical protein
LALKERLLILFDFKLTTTFLTAPIIMSMLLQIILNPFLTNPVQHPSLCTPQSVLSPPHIYADEVNMAVNRHE